MDHFQYHDGVLYADGLDVEAIAEAAGTPCYVYCRRTIHDHYQRLSEAFAPLDPLICYAIKSCSNLSILRELVGLGAGMDLVSGGELHRARLAGVDPARCVFAGVGKTDAEILEALSAGVGWFNVESEAEFANISRLAAEHGFQGKAALRINPDVDPKTHRHTSTGQRETKFGVDLERARAFFARFGRDKSVRLAGLHLHIGSPVYDTGAHEEAVRRALELVDQLAADGFTVEMLDLGGGWGADYEDGQSPPPAAYAERLIPLLERRNLEIVIEPGRMIMANAGVLLTRVLYTKQGGDRMFVICDAGMNTLLRPSHYEAFHFIWPAHVEAGFVPLARRERLSIEGLELADVVGPICETGDYFARDRWLPPVKRGDLLAVFSCGAYGMTMASRYNSVPLPAEVLVDGNELTLIRAAESYDDLVTHENDPRGLPVRVPLNRQREIAP